MKRLKPGTGFAIFVLFFGVATLDALQSGDLRRAILWLAFGAVFLVFDNLKKMPT